MTKTPAPIRPAKPSKPGWISLRTKMLLLFGSLFAVVLIGELLIDLHGVPFTEIGGEYDMEQEEVFRNLNLIADLKKDRLKRWIQERKADVALLSGEEHLSLTVSELIADIKARRALKKESEQLWNEVQQLSGYQQLQEHLTRLRLAYPEFESVSILESSTLTCIASSQSSDLGCKHRELFQGVDHLGLSMSSFVSDITIDESTDRLAFHLVGAIRKPTSENGLLAEVIALLVIQMDPEDVIKPILYTGSGLGKTGEVLLVNQNRTVLTRLKHALADGSIARPLYHVIEARPASRAAQGTEGLIRAIDYRGEPVLAAYRHLRVSPEIGWGMITKMDEAEAYAQIRNKLKINYVVSFFGIVVVLGLVILISRNLSDPILRLSQVAKDVEAGRLSARAAETGSDEVGLLSRSFNSMVDRLQHWHEELEQQVRMRTSELEFKNKELLGEITDRKRAEKALKQSEKGLRRAQQLARVGSWEWNVKQGLFNMSDEMRRIYGVAESDPIDNPQTIIARVVHPDDKEMVIRASGALSTDHAGGELVFRIVKSDGEVRWISASAPEVSIRDIKGIPEVIIGTIQEITDRKVAERALYDSKARFQELFDSITEGIGIVDVNEVIEFCNPAFVRLFEADTANDLIGRNILEFLSAEQGEVVLNATADRKQGKSTEYELELTTARGNRKIIRASVSPKFDNNDEYIGAIGAISDITETKRLQELESRAERLETAGTIAGQVAHDFNNLLAPIMAYPEFIHDELPHDHKAHAYLDAIEDAAKKIADINQDLMTMGRRGHYNLEVLDLNRIVLQAAQELESRTKTVTVELELCEDLMKIKGGAAQIHRMLTNLLVNAQDAMEDIGQVVIKTENYYADDTSVAFGRVPKGEYIKLTVSDTGCGIPDDITQKILDPFFSTKTTDKKRGSGLGLSVVDAVMKDHNGYLDLSSKVGYGTSFYVYFPVTRDGAGEEASEHLAGGTETVLVVDDDNIQREVSSQLLTKLGYKITTVVSGEKAIEFLRENPQDLVIIDMVMPGGIDGTETYQRILELGAHQKAILLSGFSESDRVLDAQKLGAGAFVRKPVTKSVIAAAVRTELDRPVQAVTS